jgi:hypothetical protein
VLGRWALAGVVLAGLVAVDLIPIGIYSRHSVRLAGVALEDVSQGSIGPVNLLQLLDPLVLGGPSDYWGPGLYYWETVCHFGVLPLALAAVGAVGGFRRYPVARFAVLWVVAVLFALGDNTPLFPFLYRFVPGVSLFRAPSRALFFCSFCGAVLAGAGLDYLLAQAGRVAEFGRIPGRRLGLLGVVAALAVAGVFAWPWLQPDEAASTANANSSDAWQLAVQGLDPLRLSLWASGTLLVLCLFAVGGRWSRYAVSGALVLIVAELACHAGAVLRTIPAGSLRAENPVREFLQREAGLSRVFVGQELLSDREAWQHGIHKVQGYDPVPLARLGMYASALLPRSDAAQQMAGFVPFRLEDLRKPLADAFGIRYAVLGGESVKDVEGWRLVQRGRVREEVALRGRRAKEIPYAIYENETVLPRAYVVGRGVPVDPQGDVLRQLSTLDPRQQVLLPADVLPSGPRASFSPASIVHYAPSRVTVQVALAVVDGKPARVLPAHAAFRAVALERGKHTVDFVYSPPGAKLGAGISLLTLLALALAWRKSRGADVPAGRCDRQGELES